MSVPRVMTRRRVIVVATVALLLLVLMLQNLEYVTTSIYFLQVRLPLAVLLAGVAIVSYAIGVITDGRVFRRPKGPLEQKATEAKTK